MSFPVVPTAVVFLHIWHLVTGAVECDEKRLWQTPIACEHSLPCLFMSPLIDEVFPKSFSRKEIFANSHTCDCVSGSCIQPTVFVMGQTVKNVPCRPESCRSTLNPVVKCEKKSECIFAYPYVGSEYADDWTASDLNCVCMESTCKATVTVGIRTNLNRTMMVDCRGIQV